MTGHAATINLSGADMMPACEWARRFLVLALVSQTASCRGGVPHDGGPRALGPCPPVPPSAYATQSVKARFVPIELRIAAGEFQTRTYDDEIERGQAWIGPAGFVVSYGVRTEVVRQREPSIGDSDFTICTEYIDGREAVISMLYSEATTASGQRVVAIWKLEDGKSLVVNVFHPNRDRRNDLLSIVRSVRFIQE